MAILGDLVPPRQLGRWLGYQGAIFAVGGVAGPLAGGLFVDYLSWRWAFYFNVPVALFAMALVATNLKVPYRRVAHSIDYLGSALLTGALVALVLLTTAGGRSIPWVVAGVRRAAARDRRAGRRCSFAGSATPRSRSCRSACSRTRSCAW